MSGVGGEAGAGSTAPVSGATAGASRGPLVVAARVSALAIGGGATTCGLGATGKPGACGMSTAGVPEAPGGDAGATGATSVGALRPEFSTSCEMGMVGSTVRKAQVNATAPRPSAMADGMIQGGTARWGGDRTGPMGDRCLTDNRIQSVFPGSVSALLGPSAPDGRSTTATGLVSGTMSLVASGAISPLEGGDGDSAAARSAGSLSGAARSGSLANRSSGSSSECLWPDTIAHYSNIVAEVVGVLSAPPRSVIELRAHLVHT